MATLDWPTTAAYVPREFTWGARSPKSRFVGFFTGNSQSVGHLADRLVARLVLKPASDADAAHREAFLMEAVSAGHLLRLGHLVRPVPRGTLRGTPQVGTAVLAGARQVTLQTTAGATLQAGDVLGAPQQLLIVGSAGATATGSGVATVPLALPLRLPLAGGTALTWQAPRGVFELVEQSFDFTYAGGRFQDSFSLSLLEHY